MIVTPVTVDSVAMSFVLAGLTLPAQKVSAIAALKDGVENIVKRRVVLVCLTQIVLVVVLATVPLGRATANQVGLGEGVKSQLALVLQCAVLMGNARLSGLNHSVIVIRAGWVGRARLNVNMADPRKRRMVHMSACVTDATVV